MTDSSQGPREYRPFSSVISHPDPDVEFYTIDDLLRCIKNNRRWSPQALQFLVDGNVLGKESGLEIMILIVPTSIRIVFDPYYDSPRECFEAPEYEFEGWLLGDYREKIWVAGDISANADGEPVGGSIYSLKPGEEVGTLPSPWRRVKPRPSD